MLSLWDEEHSYVNPEVRGCSRWSRLTCSRAPPRPTPIPVLVGSDTFGRVQSGIPTQRRGPRPIYRTRKDAIATDEEQSYTGGQAPTSRPPDSQGEHSSQLPAPVAPVDEVCIKGVDHGGPTRGLSAASEAEIATRTSRVGTYRALKVDEVGTAISPTLNAAS